MLMLYAVISGIDHSGLFDLSNVISHLNHQWLCQFEGIY